MSTAKVHTKLHEAVVREAPDTEPPAFFDHGARLAEARSIVQRNALWTLGTGVVPVPVFDLVAVTGVQLKMLRELSRLYGRRFNKGLAKKALAALFTGLGSVGLGGAIARSLVKFIPVVGTALGVISISAVSVALTVATGRVFTMHFESGGTLLDFDARAMREHFRREFEEANESGADFEHE